MARADIPSLAVLLAAACLAAPGPAARAEDPPPESTPVKRPYDTGAALLGSNTFRTYCASCHGRTGRGDGPLAQHLRFAPADLTRIGKRNGGRFEFEKVAKVIDGREALKGHGGTDMPVWGDAFLQSREGYDAAKVKQKIEELTHFLASIQD